MIPKRMDGVNEKAAAAMSREGNRVRLLALALAVFALNFWRYHTYLLDDAFIAFRYARHLVEGQGLVFNAGERVEGYSNFLFVVLIAALMKLGIDPVVGTKLVSFGATVGLLLLLAGLERRWCDGDRVPSSWLLLLPLQAFAYWSVTTLETMIFTTLLLWGVVLLLREKERRGRAGAGLVFVLVALTRSDGVFCFAVATAALLVAERIERGSWVHARRHLVNVVAFGALFAGYFAWRWRYYGHAFPNTFYAKVTGGREEVVTGLLYLRSWLLAMPVLALAVLWLPVAAVPRLRRALGIDADLGAIAAVVSTYAAYVVLIGGDSMPFFRFFVPVLPLCAVLVAVALSRARAVRWAGPALVALWSVHLGASYLTEEPYRAFVAHRTTLVGRETGRWLAERVGRNDLIAVNTAGSLPYTSGLPAIDMLGLTDETIAARPVYVVTPGWAGHRRGWGAYILERRPRVILWYNSAGAREPFYLSDRELADDPVFRFFYTLRAATLPIEGSLRHPGVAERFLGLPFGAAERAVADELGLVVEARRRPVPITTLSEGAITLRYFEFDRRDEDLWSLRSRDVPRFLAAVAARWREAREAAGPPDSAARADVERLCADAYQAVQSHDLARAKELLALAASRNEAAKSPLVYRYVANVGVLTGDLFTAVSAEKEALRLAPGDELLRSNLASLLTTPYAEATRPRKH